MQFDKYLVERFRNIKTGRPGFRTACLIAMHGLFDGVDELLYTGFRLFVFIKEQGMLLDDR